LPQTGKNRFVIYKDLRTKSVIATNPTFTLRSGEIMKVEDTPENMAICKRFCGPCPTFKPNKINEVPPVALFCARGQSTKPVAEIEDNGCSCFGCEIFRSHELKGAWFCMHGIEGRK
jgi:hypothetical protein